MKRPKRGYLLVCVVIIAYLLRIILWYMDPVLSRDSVYYLMQAKGEGFEEYSQSLPKQAPLFPRILKTMNECGIDPQKGGVLFNILCSTASCVLIWLACYHLSFSSFWCAFCSLLFAINPVLARNSHELQRESLYLFWVGCVLVLTIINYHITTRLKYYFISLLIGCTCALASVSRFEGLELLPLEVLWLGSTCLFYNRKSCVKYLNSIILIVVGWLVCINLTLIYCTYSFSTYWNDALNAASLGTVYP